MAGRLADAVLLHEVSEEDLIVIADVTTSIHTGRDRCRGRDLPSLGGIGQDHDHILRDLGARRRGVDLGGTVRGGMVTGGGVGAIAAIVAMMIAAGAGVVVGEVVEGDSQSSWSGGV